MPFNMNRVHLFEFEDQSWFPARIREYMTNYLTFLAGLSSRPFEGVAKKLKEAMVASKQTHIIDLCSGASGPLPHVIKLLQEKENYPVTALLTDLYPNLPAFQKIEAVAPGIRHSASSVDATQVPKQFQGFRTLFNSFHHFPPQVAARILENAAHSRQGIAVFEIIDRSVFSFFTILTAPIFMALLTPFIRPWSFSRLLFTYLIPVVPLFLLWDGCVSCLRAYSCQELKRLTQSISVEKYEWEIGKIPISNTPASVTYLIGKPHAERLCQ